MSDKHYFDVSRTVQLRAWGLGQMLWGALLAGAFLVVIGGVLAGIWAVGLLLPADSKTAPSPYQGAVEVIRTIEAA